MKATRGNIGRVVDQPDRSIRLFLFHGADQSQSRALADRLLKGLGAAKFAISPSALKGDPALLADEASAMSLFGGPRAIWIEPAADDMAAAAEALLAAPAAESPVIAIAGALRKTSTLLKLAEADQHALAHVSYVPEGQDAERMVSDVGRTFGLRIGGRVASRIADAAANDRAIVERELEKLALFLEASPESPKDADDEAFEAIGADVPEADTLRLGDMALAGDLDQLADAMSRLAAGGADAIPAIRALQRRLLMLAPLRARVDSGERPDAVLTSMGKSLFFKDKALFQKVLTRWDSAGLARVAERVGQLERDLMLSDAPENDSLGEELIAIGRAAARRR